MRPPTRIARLLPVVLFVLPVALGAAPASAKGGPSVFQDLVCRFDPDCRKECRKEAWETRAACIAQGGSRVDCKARSGAQRQACIASRCVPNPGCEERCRTHAAGLLDRCIASGAPIDECRRKTAAAAEACIERCPDPCICTDEYVPVCGVDGTTYGNACEARCAGVEIAHEGMCEPVCEPVLCDLFCEFGFKTDENGCEICECNEPCLCTEEYAPVCGVDGNTYGNACKARCTGVEIAHEGECRAECRSNADCPRDQVCDPTSKTCRPACQIQCFRYDPVCGTDGVTYGCGVADAHCHGVEVAHEGECGVCFGDQDCDGGTVCNAAEICLPPPGCRPGEPCPAVCTGHCVSGF